MVARFLRGGEAAAAMTPAGTTLTASALSDDAEELRRKKLLEQQQARLPPNSGVRTLGLLGSRAVTASADHTEDGGAFPLAAPCKQTQCAETSVVIGDRLARA